MIMAIGGVVALAAAGGALWYQTEQAKRRDAVWRSIAATRQGRYTEGHMGLLTSESPTLDVIVEQAVVRLDLLAVQSGKNKQLYARARAKYALGQGPAFEVKPEGVLQSVGKAFGGQDVVLGGDTRFDDEFVVKCADAEATRAAWTPEAKRLMTSTLDFSKVEADGAAVVITTYGGLDDPTMLNAMLDVAGALASTGARALATYRSIEGAEWTPCKGPFASPTSPRLTVGSTRGEVAVEVLVTGGRPRARLRIRHERATPPFSVDIEGPHAPGLPRGLVSERANEMLKRLSGVTLAGDASTLQITWREPPPADVLELGVRAIVELAGGAPSGGAFR